MKTYKIIVTSGSVYTFYQTGKLSYGNGFYEFTVDGEPGENYRETVACFPIQYSIVLLLTDEPEKVEIII